MDTEETPNLFARISSMQSVMPDSEYYRLTILATPDGIVHSTHTHWVGFTEDKPRREIRAPSIINASAYVESWEALGQSSVVVNDDDDLPVYLLIGGNAVIERSIVETQLADLNVFKTGPMIEHGPIGYTSLSEIPKNRAPTPKQRMRIMTRDGRRCRVCGRSPADYVDVELHLHHIRPWASGGPTIDNNLITLCHTCHKGLDPHEDHSLFSLIPGSQWSGDVDEDRKRYFDGMFKYLDFTTELANSWEAGTDETNECA